MKNKKTTYIALYAGLIVTALSLIVIILLKPFSQDQDMFYAGLIGLSVFIISTIVFYILTKKFIDHRLKHLFRMINSGKEYPSKKKESNIAEDPITNAEEATEKWVNERQKEIAKLKEQEAFRREFLGNLAHELKTPVFSIQGYILTLLEGGLEDKNVNRKFLERASKATERMTSILEDLDDLMKMEVNRFELNITKFDIVELAEEVIDSLEIPSKEKKITLQFDKKYNPIYVKADRGRIAQVFTNLISNAINYNNPGGTATIRFYAMEDAIVTEVSDNGPGISEKNIPRLFERFYRVEQSRNRNEGGSGLGLAIVKHIVETQHKQTISVRSTVDVGSTFSFTLNKA